MSAQAKELIAALVRHIERETCSHEETHRGGTLWEICDMCGQQWADDRGGKPDFQWPDAVEKARIFLDMKESGLCDGGTKREQFAAMVMQGLAANPGGPWQANSLNGWALVNCKLEDVAEVCTQAADALLAELAKATP